MKVLWQKKNGKIYGLTLLKTASISKKQRLRGVYYDSYIADNQKQVLM